MFGFVLRKPAAGVPGPTAAHYGLSLSACAAQAVAGVTGTDRPRVTPLGTGSDELPLTVRLDARPVEVGAVGLNRKAPHLLCANYLPQLGHARQWRAARGTAVTPEAAVGATFDAIHAKLIGAEAVGLTLPAYLTPAQVKTALALAAKAKLPVRGSAATALAIAAHRAASLLADDAPPGLDRDGSRPDWVVPLRPPAGGPAAVVVIDCDDYALTASVVGVDPAAVQLVSQTAWPKASLKLWADRLIDALSDRCVRLCRRDPRDSADAEQFLYDQFDAALDRARAGQAVTLTVRSEHWFQDLVHQPGELDGHCVALADLSTAGIAEAVRAARLPVPPRAVWLTHTAARLPGLVAALRRGSPEQTEVIALPPFAASEATAALVPRWLAGRLPRAHADAALSNDELGITNDESKLKARRRPGPSFQM